MIGIVTTPDELARRAVDGDRDAAVALVRVLQPDIYGLAIRTLWCRDDAEDATQEILMRVITRLSQFDGRSQLRTWVYRVATNYLLDVKKSAPERQRLTFETLSDDLANGLSDDNPGDAERSVLVEEVRVGCTLAMLLCLDRPHRLTYILGEILELSTNEVATALDVSDIVVRKRLQRAREAVEAFVREHCGLVNDRAPCQCNRRVATAIRLGRVDPERPRFASTDSSFVETRAVVRGVERARQLVTLYRAHPPSTPSRDFLHELVTALDALPNLRSHSD